MTKRKEQEVSTTAICTKCVLEPHLNERLANIQPEDDASCSLCGEKNGQVRDASKDSDFGNVLKASIRYVYPARKYNTEEVFGKPIETLLITDQEILDVQRLSEIDPNWGEEKKEFLLGLLEPLAPSSDAVGVSLHPKDYACWRGSYNSTIEKTGSGLFEFIEDKMGEKNFYLYEDRIKRIFERAESSIRYAIEPGREFWRARIGIKERKLTPWDGGSPIVEYVVPYSEKDLAAPPQKKTNAGRMNRQYVSFLYLAEDKETAIAEVRPHPGHEVTIGRFKTIQELSFANLTTLNYNNFCTSNREIEDYMFLRCLNRSFSMPVIPEETSKYMISQLAAETLLRCKYDGVVFNSSVGTGENLTCFWPDKFSYVEHSSCSVTIKDVTYDHEPLE